MFSQNSVVRYFLSRILRIAHLTREGGRQLLRFTDRHVKKRLRNQLGKLYCSSRCQ